LQRLQILLVDMPLMLRELIEEAVAAQPDMNVVAAIPDAGSLLTATREKQPDFVLFGVNQEDAKGFPAACLALLGESPRTQALGIEAIEGHAYLYELRPQRTALGEVGPEDLVTAIRKAAAQRPPRK
jgi:DNA-binding NarL/FixJ family response regulator